MRERITCLRVLCYTKTPSICWLSLYISLKMIKYIARQLAISFEKEQRVGSGVPSFPSFFIHSCYDSRHSHHCVDYNCAGNWKKYFLFGCFPCLPEQSIKAAAGSKYNAGLLLLANLPKREGPEDETNNFQGVKSQILPQMLHKPNNWYESHPVLV